jgi:hypothetical protein
VLQGPRPQRDIPRASEECYRGPVTSLVSPALVPRVVGRGHTCSVTTVLQQCHNSLTQGCINNNSVTRESQPCHNSQPQRQKNGKQSEMAYVLGGGPRLLGLLCWFWFWWLLWPLGSAVCGPRARMLNTGDRPDGVWLCV